eukprot:1006626-Prymnesium_polylepis.2
MWPAERRAIALRDSPNMYRGGAKRGRMPDALVNEEAVDEALELMQTNDYTQLNRNRAQHIKGCLLYTSPSPRDAHES